ncbi:MAG: cytochrome d ubiquinol oxidase subunit II, partial [Anaerolineae bacterium]
MDLQTVWFILIGILFTGFFLLEGFDYGVGILMPFLGKDDTDRRLVINTIGPHWDGNEVWLIV